VCGQHHHDDGRRGDDNYHDYEYDHDDPGGADHDDHDPWPDLRQRRDSL
jgi:hypothetical protein